MKRTIKKVAVIGSELWVQELLAILPTLVSVLLDISERTDLKLKLKRLTLESKAVRNR
jgi:hypothetical protein